MLVTPLWPILRNVALLAVLSLQGQRESWFSFAVTTQDSQPSAAVAGLNQVDPGTPVPIMPLSPRRCPTCPFTATSGIKGRLRLLVRDHDAWLDVWKAINQPRVPMPPLPEIDFSREMLVVVGLGEKRTGGYSIVVDRAYESAEQLEIEVVSQSPGRNCVLTQVLTQPVDIARLPRTHRSVAFHDTEVVHECR